MPGAKIKTMNLKERLHILAANHAINEQAKKEIMELIRDAYIAGVNSGCYLTKKYPNGGTMYAVNCEVCGKIHKIDIAPESGEKYRCLKCLKK